METTRTAGIDYDKLIQQLGTTFSSRAKNNDEHGRFVYENYEDLKKHELFSALIPKELGGLGISYSEMCGFIKNMAKYCASTALAFSMHQHLVAASVWKYKHKGVGEDLLRNIVSNQLVLVSTGAKDWLGSNGEMKKVEGGYILNAKKHFASQSVVGDIAITSAPYLNENNEWKVLHFPVNFKSKGVSTFDDWNVLGMRATGSHTLLFQDVFVPEEAIALERYRDEFHPVWNVVLTVAMPLIMSVYVGIAEKAKNIAIAKAKADKYNQEHIKFSLGKLYNAFISVETQWEAMVGITKDLNFALEHDNSVHILSLKTNVSNTCIDVVSQTMDLVGGQSFYRSFELERLFRDVQASRFHPLPKWSQYAFTGQKLMQQ